MILVTVFHGLKVPVYSQMHEPLRAIDLKRKPEDHREAVMTVEITAEDHKLLSRVRFSMENEKPI